MQNFENITLGEHYKKSLLTCPVKPEHRKTLIGYQWAVEKRYQGEALVWWIKLELVYPALEKDTNVTVKYFTRLFIFKDGRAKAVTKTSLNGKNPMQETKYFHPCGREIIEKNRKTRKELQYWKSLRENS